MRNPNPSGAVPSPTSAYSPSVPISLYREVSAELQASRATMEALKQQNQQLAKQNQHLRQEIEKAAQSAIHLRQTITHLPPVQSEVPTPRSESISPAMPPSIPTMPNRPLPTPPKIVRTEAETKFSSDNLVFEQESQPRRKLQSEQKSAELGGWWLGLVIVMIVVTAFGTGFLIVRPLLPSGK
ncbi:MAG: hypothetical protein HC780_10915 [Leptolyngbyaceae cyanobacterium CSU_1_3]|nr:hypothetical protein [Leptolyngbyaceae cyanobacterium CSU_1_3]